MAQMNPYNIPLRNLTLICGMLINGLKNFKQSMCQVVQLLQINQIKQDISLLKIADDFKMQTATHSVL